MTGQTQENGTMTTISVRYMVNDVEEAISF
jgi:hypothetical protein